MRSEDAAHQAAIRRVTLFAPCGDCRCEGFRPAVDGLPHNYERQNGLFYFDLEVYDQYQLPERCMTCDHELRDHMPAAAAMKKDDLLYYSQVVKDAYDIYALINSEYDREKLRLYLQVYETMVLTMKKCIATPERIILYNTDERDLEPSAHTVLASLLHEISLGNTEKRNRWFRMAGIFLTKMNQWVPEPLDKIDYVAQQIDMASYRLFYSQWFIKVHLPQKFRSLKQFELPEAFGSGTLVLFIRQFLAGKFENKNTDPFFIFATVLHKNLKAFFKISECNKAQPPHIVNMVRYRKHSTHREPSPESNMAVFKKRALQPQRGRSSQLSHKQMVSLLARIVELERTDQFGTDENGEDKMSADVAKAEIVKQEVEAGLVQFLFVKNNLEMCQSHAELAWLVQLKTLFNAQLPKMGVDYITRLVFDANHCNLALIRNCRVIGGCCFRPFTDRKFIEIVFLAVSSHDQIKGYGTILMNYMKDYAVKRGMFLLLTFADAFATGYFKKQGFTTDITAPPSMHKGFIKEYEGATLMGCELHPMIRYVTFASYIKGVRDMNAALHITLNPIRSKIYPGIEELFQEYPDEPVPLEEVPGMTERIELRSSTECDSDDSAEEPIQPDLTWRLKKFMIKLREDPNAWPFLQPVKAEECPEYAEYVRYPADIDMIETRILQRLFLADLTRMFSNCYSFNGPDTEYYRCGYKLNKVAINLIEEYFPGTDVFPHLPEDPDSYLQEEEVVKIEKKVTRRRVIDEGSDDDAGNESDDEKDSDSE